MSNTTTMTSSPIPTPANETRRHHDESKLRRVLRLNAASSLASGTAMTLAAEPIDELLGTGHPGWVRLVGCGLLPFAALWWWVAAGPVQRLRKLTPLLVAGDVDWVIASVATVLLGWYSGSGVVAVLAMAVVVDTFAVLQFVGWRRLRTIH